MHVSSVLLGSSSGMCLYLQIPGASQVEKGKHRRSYDVYMSVATVDSLALYRCCCFVLLLCCADALKNSGEVWVGIVPRCSGWHAHIIRIPVYVHTQKHRL